MNKELPLRIKQIMKDKGISTYQMAQTLNMSQPALSLRINGNNPTIKSLMEIAGVLGVNIADLFILPKDYVRYEIKNPRYAIQEDSLPFSDDDSSEREVNKEGEIQSQEVQTTAFCPHCGTKVRVGVVLIQE